MRILGLSAFHRDSAAALLVDGELVAAAQEERFTRTPREPGFPTRALRWCLASGGVRAGELDHVVFYEKPLRKLERVLAGSLRAFPRSGRSFSKSLFVWLGERIWIRDRIARDLELPPERVLFVEQARAQLAHAFFASPFDEAALLLLDDVCEWTTTAFGRARGTTVELVLELRHPDSLGLFASALTQYLGMAPGADEHRLEALAAFGAATRRAELDRLLRAEDPFFALAGAAFRFEEGAARLFGPELERRLGPARRPGAEPGLAPGDADLAASVQEALEERALALAHELQRRVALPHLCVAGLLAGNRSLVARLARDGPFRELFVAPAAGKAGGAVGAALFAHHALDPQAKRILPSSTIAACARGEAIGDLAEPGAVALGGAERAHEELLRRLLAGERVGWVHGALELADRSFANRVALACPRAGEARPPLLAALQHREPFLPCRIALPVERWSESFPGEPGALARGARILVPARDALRAHAPASLLPDGRAWPQAVHPLDAPALHALLLALARAGRPPLLWLADLALRGAPVVRSEAEAVEAFGRSELDALVAGSRLYTRD